jgi:predicted transcriptional regulator
MRKQEYTIVLPAAVGRRVARAARKEKRASSEVAVDALRWYLARNGILTEVPTAREIAAIRRGEAAFRNGDFSKLDDYFRSVGRSPRRLRKKVY